MLVKYCLVHCK